MFLCKRVFIGATIHYLIAKIGGTFIIGRWGMVTGYAMVCNTSRDNRKVTH